MRVERKVIFESGLEELYGSYKAREIQKILSRSDWQDKIQEYLTAKAKVDVLTVTEDDTNRTRRCVAYLINNEEDEIVQYFVGNQNYKPAGLKTTVQLSYLCKTEWKDVKHHILRFLEVARTTKVADRKAILKEAGFKNKPLLFLEYLLQTELNLSLVKSRSKFYDGYSRKEKNVYDAEAES